MSNIPQPRKKRWYKRWWFWFLLSILVLLAISVPAVSSSFHKAQLAKYAYLEESVEVEKQSFAKTISTSGVITPDEAQLMYVSVPSKVTEVNFSVGDEVNRDDVIIKTESEEIKASFDGRLLEQNAFVDGTVRPDMPVVELGYRSTHIELYASDNEVIDLEKGQTVNLIVSAYDSEDEEYTGEVEFVDTKKTTTASTTTGVAESGYLVKISVGDLPEELTKIVGLSVDTEIIVDEKTNVLALPSGAIQHDENDDPFVYRVPTVDDAFVQKATQAENITDVLESQEVEIGFVGDEYTEITSGLKEGDKVLLYVANSETATPF